MTEIRTSTAIVMRLHPLGKGGIVETRHFERLQGD